MSKNCKKKSATYALCFFLTCSMDRNVEPRYALMIWHGRRPIMVAWRYLRSEQTTLNFFDTFKNIVS